MEDLERLNKIRETIEKATQKRSRLTGEKEAQTKRQEEIKAQCKEELDIEFDKLSDFKEGKQKEAEEALEKAEKLLGL